LASSKGLKVLAKKLEKRAVKKEKVATRGKKVSKEKGWPELRTILGVKPGRRKKAGWGGGGKKGKVVEKLVEKPFPKF